PMPNKIPEDGSTIYVYVNGVNKGNATYNMPRPDILSFFPGYANADGPGAVFYLDTTQFSNGVNTISWHATDDDGNSDGIGSRFFKIQNSGGSARNNSPTLTGISRNSVESLNELPIDVTARVSVKKGANPSTKSKIATAGEKGLIHVAAGILEPLEIVLPEEIKQVTAYLLVNSSLRRLPIGSTYDPVKSIFYWTPVPGFLGEYRLVFLGQGQGNERKRIDVSVHLSPPIVLR
ncbi:MAG: hypothetical protein GY757_21800, partial [bacterium]|nr:hypothetical protein [bacterium]